MPFDPTKPVQTRDGRKARIICTDAKNNQPIIALHEIDDDGEAIRYHEADGKWFAGEECNNDLINVQEKRIHHRWINIYPSGAEIPHASKESADKAANTSRIACIEITKEYTVGEGL
jgi:hypothetical protein